MPSSPAPAPAPAAVESRRAQLRLVRPSRLVGELLHPEGLDPACSARLEVLTSGRRNVPRGAALYRSGDRLSSLFEVRSGFFKTCVCAEDGRNQVIGFHRHPELLGLDGIGTGRHHCDAVALEDSQVCSIAYEELEGLISDHAELRQRFHRIMSREFVRIQTMMMLLGSMCAEERVAAFLLELAQGPNPGDRPASRLILCMTREEIGSYLGLKLETVSRIFSRLQGEGVLEVKQRHIHLVDLPALQQIAHRTAA